MDQESRSHITGGVINMVVQTETRIIECLKHTQANALVLYLNNKRYHWFTYGPLFRDMHLFFDEMANAAFGEVDPFGERARYLGGDPISTPDEINRWATIRIAQGKPTPREMLQEACDNERQVIREMRDAATLADEQHDPGTNDLYSQHVQTHEKFAWFIEEFLRQQDGMVA
jgi:starvation-inducible DNA-binding protein